jgi:hypothetical protein
VLIDQVPHASLDHVVDPIEQRLIGNPEHDVETNIALYCIEGTSPTGTAGHPDA